MRLTLPRRTRTNKNDFNSKGGLGGSCINESVGALSAEPLTAGSKRSRRLPPPSGLAEPAKRRCDNDGGEGGSEGDEDEEGCPADHLIIKYGQCGAPACYKAALVRHARGSGCLGHGASL
jgi:hypothetical protein